MGTGSKVPQILKENITGSEDGGARRSIYSSPIGSLFLMNNFNLIFKILFHYLILLIIDYQAFDTLILYLPPGLAFFFACVLRSSPV